MCVVSVLYLPWPNVSRHLFVPSFLTSLIAAISVGSLKMLVGYTCSINHENGLHSSFFRNASILSSGPEARDAMRYDVISCQHMNNRW